MSPNLRYVFAAILGSIFIVIQVQAQIFSKTYDLYQSTKSRSAVVLFVHGGAWISGNKEQYRYLGEALQKQNLCAAIMKYTLTPDAQHPKQVQELNVALKQLTKLKSKKCDTKRIYLIGHSAGAHMIAYWATKYSIKNVRGFVGLEGIYDLNKLGTTWQDYEDWFLKKEFGDRKNWEKASPTKLKMRHQAKWLVVHSDKDELVDLKQSIEFHRSLKLQNINAEFLHLEKEKHFEVVDQLKDSSSSLTLNLLRFVGIKL